MKNLRKQVSQATTTFANRMGGAQFQQGMSLASQEKLQEITALVQKLIPIEAEIGQLLQRLNPPRGAGPVGAGGVGGLIRMHREAIQNKLIPMVERAINYVGQAISTGNVSVDTLHAWMMQIYGEIKRLIDEELHIKEITEVHAQAMAKLHEFEETEKQIWHEVESLTEAASTTERRAEAAIDAAINQVLDRLAATNQRRLRPKDYKRAMEAVFDLGIPGLNPKDIRARVIRIAKSRGFKK